MLLIIDSSILISINFAIFANEINALRKDNMSKLIAANTAYSNWLVDIKQRYHSAQIKASIKVNSEMLKFYWMLGSGFYKNLSADLKRELPDTKGFLPTNIKYFKYFYELYSPLFENRPQVADDFGSQNITEQLFSIPWDHHLQIINLHCQALKI